MSIEEKLQIVASTVLESLFSSNAVELPVSSFDLLTRVISFGPSPGLLPGSSPPPRFRLVDLPRFERILERLSENWAHGNITVSRDEEPDGGLTVMDVKLGVPSTVDRPQTTPVLRKRKRIVDEDDDSAVGRAQEAEDSTPEKAELWKPAASTLESLNKTVKEVYSIMQQSTAKGKLLAEQVCHFACFLYMLAHRCDSSGHLLVALSPFALISPRKSVLGPVVHKVHRAHRRLCPASATASISDRSSDHTPTLH